MRKEIASYVSDIMRVISSFPTSIRECPGTIATGANAMLFSTPSSIASGLRPISKRAVSTAGKTPWGGASPLNRTRSSGSQTQRCSGTSPSMGMISSGTPAISIDRGLSTSMVGGKLKGSLASGIGEGPMPLPTVPSSLWGSIMPICK